MVVGLAPWWMVQAERSTVLTQGAKSSSWLRIYLVTMSQDVDFVWLQFGAHDWPYQLDHRGIE